LANALNDEIAARQAADTALANKLAGIPQVFVGAGSVNNLKGATATVASKNVPAGTYFILASIQMVNGQNSGDANARCVMKADGNLLADTTDLQFPLLSTPSGTAVRRSSRRCRAASVPPVRSRSGSTARRARVPTAASTRTSRSQP